MHYKNSPVKILSSVRDIKWLARIPLVDKDMFENETCHKSIFEVI